MNNKITMVWILLAIFIGVGIMASFFLNRKAIDVSLIVGKQDASFYRLDFSNGVISNISIDGYLADKPDMLVLKEHQKVFVANKTGMYEIFSTDMYIWGNLILHNDDVYFIATETDDKYLESYIYKYSNGNVERLYNGYIDSISALLCDGENLLFVEEVESERPKFPNYVVKKINFRSGDVSTVCEGRNIAWKDEKETFFCTTSGTFFDKGLSVVNVESGMANVINQDLIILGSPVYNEKHELLLIVYQDNDSTGAGGLSIPALLNVNNSKIIDIHTYFRKLLFKWNIKEHLELFSPSNTLFWSG